MSDRRLRTIAVVGSGRVVEGDRAYEMARRLGERLVERGFRLVTGGRGGVMEAACRGARQAESYREGRTVGILPGDTPDQANRWVDVAIPTGLGIARNAIVAHSDGLIAVEGGAGTLSEVAMARKLGRPVVALEIGGTSGRVAGRRLDTGGVCDDPEADRVWSSKSATEAVDKIEELVGGA